MQALETFCGFQAVMLQNMMFLNVTSMSMYNETYSAQIGLII